MEIVKSKRGGARPNTGGARPGAGRKSKAEEFGLREILDSAWKLTDRHKVIQKLTELSLGGDTKAAALLLAYAYGKPHETIQATVTHRDYEVEIGGISTGEPEDAEQFVN